MSDEDKKQPNGWNEYSRLVLSELERAARNDVELNEKMDCLDRKLTVLQTTIDTTPILIQPCTYFKEFKKEQKEEKEQQQKNMDSWRKPIIVGIVSLIFIFIQEPIRAFVKRMFTGP